MPQSGPFCRVLCQLSQDDRSAVPQQRWNPHQYYLDCCPGQQVSRHMDVDGGPLAVHGVLGTSSGKHYRGHSMYTVFRWHVHGAAGVNFGKRLCCRTSFQQRPARFPPGRRLSLRRVGCGVSPKMSIRRHRTQCNCPARHWWRLGTSTLPARATEQYHALHSTCPGGHEVCRHQ